MDSVSLTRLLLSSSVIPVHASMLYLACPSLRAMAVAPAASGLTSWKFLLSNHVTDAAVRTYFSFLYTPNHLSFGFSNQIFIYFPPPYLCSYNQVVEATLASPALAADARAKASAVPTLSDHAGASNSAMYIIPLAQTANPVQEHSLPCGSWAV
jgi:hypothetical protein